jgi:predicted Zn-dependent peptidase
LAACPKTIIQKHRIAPALITGGYYDVEKAISQTHCVLGSRAYPSAHQNKYGLLLLNNLLGGMGMSNRLKPGDPRESTVLLTLSKAITPRLTDTGIFSIYFGTDAEKADKALKLVHKELKKLRDNKIGTIQLKQAKEKFIGQIALAEENRLSLIISMAKSLLDFDRIDSLEDIFNKINAVTAEDLLEISNEIFDNDRMITLLFEPK